MAISVHSFVQSHFSGDDALPNMECRHRCTQGNQFGYPLHISSSVNKDQVITLSYSKNQFITTKQFKTDGKVRCTIDERPTNKENDVEHNIIECLNIDTIDYNGNPMHKKM